MTDLRALDLSILIFFTPRKKKLLHRALPRSGLGQQIPLVAGPGATGQQLRNRGSSPERTHLCALAFGNKFARTPKELWGGISGGEGFLGGLGWGGQNKVYPAHFHLLARICSRLGVLFSSRTVQRRRRTKSGALPRGPPDRRSPASRTASVFGRGSRDRGGVPSWGPPFLPASLLLASWRSLFWHRFLQVPRRHKGGARLQPPPWRQGSDPRDLGGPP